MHRSPSAPRPAARRRPPTRWRICKASIASMAYLTLTHSPACAEVITKAPNLDDLILPSSWVNGIVPGALDLALWDSTVIDPTVVALGGNLSWLGLRITNVGTQAGTAPITISAGSTLTLGTAGIDMSAATQDLTINAGVTIANGKQVWNVADGRTLTLAALPTKPGHPGPNNAGVLQLGTTGSIFLGAGTTNLITDNQGNPWATYGLNDWAGLNAGRVVASTYVAATTALTAGQVNDVQGSFTLSGTVDVAALRFDASTAFNIDLSTSGSARTLTARGILVTANSAGGSIGGNLNGSSFIRPARSSIANTAFNVIQNSASDFLIGAIISNGSSGAPTQLVKSGTGRLILAGANGYTGGTTINEGTLQIGNGGATGVLGAGDVTNHGALTFNRSNQLDVIHNIHGSGSVTQAGSGELVFSTNVSTYSGPTNLNAGTLTFASLQNLGAGTAINFDGGTLKYATGNTTDISVRTVTLGTAGGTINTNGNVVTFANAIGNGAAGGLTKVGGGTLVLGAGNNYGGATMVTAGTLQLANASGSATGSGAVTISTGATLGGSGSIAGTVDLGSGAILAPGAGGVGSLSMGGLTLAAGSVLTFEFGAVANDLVTITNPDAFTLHGGGLNIFQAGTTNLLTTPGTYNLFSFAGNLQGAGLGALTFLNEPAGIDYTLATSGNFVTLNVAIPGLITAWSSAGGGSWATGANWSNTVPDAAGATAQFGNAITAPSTITLDGVQTVGALSFDSTHSYTIAPGTGGSLRLEKAGDDALIMNVSGSHFVTAPVALISELKVDTSAGGSIVLSGEISGTRGITKSGPGTLTLQGANSYTGNTTVSGGTLEFSASESLGTGTELTINGARLRWLAGNTADVSQSRLVRIGTSGATFDTNGNSVALLGPIGETAGGLTKVGVGTLTLLGENTYGGPTTITQGMVSIIANSGLGTPASGAGVVLDGGGLQAVGAFSLSDFGTANRPMTLAPGGGTIDVTEFSALSVPGLISGSGSLHKTGLGSLTVSDVNNSWTGVTTLSGGTLVLGANVSFGNGGMGPSPIVFDGGTLGHAQGANNTLIYTAASPMSVPTGKIGLVQTPNRFRWNSAVSGAGALAIQIGTNVSRADFQNDFSGFTGDLSLTGTGTVRIGVLALASGQPNFNVNGWAGTTLSLDGVVVTVNTNSGGNVLQIGALSSEGTAGILGGTFNAGPVTWEIGAKNLATTFHGTITDGIVAAVAVPTNVRKVGTAFLELSGANAYTGTTTVQAGILHVSGSLSATSSISVGLSARLQVGVNDALNDLAPLTLDGGTLQTLGFSDTVGTLTLANTATIDLGAGASLLKFAASMSQPWNGTLSITNWNGAGAGGGTDQIFFGLDGTGLSLEQIAAVQFLDPAGVEPGNYPAQLLATGELVAVVPEPGAVALLLLGATSLCFRRSRRR